MSSFNPNPKQLEQPKSNLVAPKPAAPKLADGTHKLALQSTKGLRIATGCTSVDQFVATFHRFCEGSVVFVANTRRAVGAVTEFSFTLNDGKIAFSGIGTVIEEHATAQHKFGRPGIVIELQRLEGEHAKVFDRLLAARAAKPETKAPPPVMKPKAARASTVIGIPTISKEPAKAAAKEPAKAPSVKVPTVAPPTKKATGSTAMQPVTVKVPIAPMKAAEQPAPEIWSAGTPLPGTPIPGASAVIEAVPAPVDEAWDDEPGNGFLDSDTIQEANPLVLYNLGLADVAPPVVAAPAPAAPVAPPEEDVIYWSRPVSIAEPEPVPPPEPARELAPETLEPSAFGAVPYELMLDPSQVRSDAVTMTAHERALSVADAAEAQVEPPRRLLTWKRVFALSVAAMAFIAAAATTIIIQESKVAAAETSDVAAQANASSLAAAIAAAPPVVEPEPARVEVAPAREVAREGLASERQAVETAVAPSAPSPIVKKATPVKKAPVHKKFVKKAVKKTFKPKGVKASAKPCAGLDCL